MSGCCPELPTGRVLPVGTRPRRRPRTPSAEVDPLAPRGGALAADLLATQRAAPGCVGLAAPQVGVAGAGVLPRRDRSPAGQDLPRAVGPGEPRGRVGQRGGRRGGRDACRCPTSPGDVDERPGWSSRGACRGRGSRSADHRRVRGAGGRSTRSTTWTACCSSTGWPAPTRCTPAGSTSDARTLGLAGAPVAQLAEALALKAGSSVGSSPAGGTAVARRRNGRERHPRPPTSLRWQVRTPSRTRARARPTGGKYHGEPEPGLQPQRRVLTPRLRELQRGAAGRRPGSSRTCTTRPPPRACRPAG